VLYQHLLVGLGQQGFFREDREEFVACSRVEIEMD